MKLSRRKFLQSSSSAFLVGTLVSAFPRRADAWVVTAVIAVASLATSLMARGPKAKAGALVAQANLQILTSISQEVGAINQGLQNALIQLTEIRNLVKKIPQETVALSNHNDMAKLWRRYREKLTAYVDPTTTATTASDYYSSLKKLYEEYALARSGLMEVTPETAYDYAIHVAVAQEHEMMMALELVSDEAIEAGISYDLNEIKVALRDSYLPFLRSSIDPNVKESIPSTISKLEKEILDRRKSIDGTFIGKFFTSGKSGGIVCKKTVQHIETGPVFRQTCPNSYLAMGRGSGCERGYYRQYTLHPLELYRRVEKVSEERSLFFGSKKYGKNYSYGASVWEIVEKKHNIPGKICDGNVDNAQYARIDDQEFQSWRDGEKYINALQLAVESLYHAQRVCELSIANAECRVLLLETGENACGV